MIKWHGMTAAKEKGNGKINLIKCHDNKMIIMAQFQHDNK